MSRPDDPSLLRGQLVAAAIRLGFTRDEAEDLAGDAWLKASGILGGAEERRAYAFQALRTLTIDHRGSPGRVFAKRLATLLTRAEGKDPLEAFPEPGGPVVGLRSQRHLRPAGSADLAEINGRLQDFLYGPGGLMGKDPTQMAARWVVETFFKWLGRPMERAALIAFLAPIAVVPVTAVGIEEGFEIPARPQEAAVDPHGFLERVRALPYRMRAAVLLSMDEQDLGIVHPDARGAIVGSLPEWRPPPRLEDAPFPLDDDLVADKLGVTRPYLQKIRERGKAALQAAMALVLEPSPASRRAA